MTGSKAKEVTETRAFGTWAAAIPAMGKKRRLHRADRARQQIFRFISQLSSGYHQISAGNRLVSVYAAGCREGSLISKRRRCQPDNLFSGPDVPEYFLTFPLIIIYEQECPGGAGAPARLFPAAVPFVNLANPKIN
jgi:hypothetical protein